MERAKLKAKVSRERLMPRARAIDPADDSQWEDTPVKVGANQRIAELEHEIRMIQNSAREMLNKAQNEGRRLGEASMKRKTDKIIVELELDVRNLRQQLERQRQAHNSNLVPGSQYACPHCGVVSDGPDEELEEGDALDPALRGLAMSVMH